MAKSISLIPSAAKKAAEFLSTSVDALSAEILVLLTALAATGFVASIALDLLKNLLQPRLYLQRSAYRYHFSQRLRNLSANQVVELQELGLEIGGSGVLNDAEIEHFVQQVEKEVAASSTGGDTDLLYFQNIDTVAGYFKSAVNIAISFPQDHSSQLILVALSNGLSFNCLTEIAKGKTDENLRARVTKRLDGNLGGLQTQLKIHWSWLLHVGSVVLSTATILSLVPLTLGWIAFATGGGLLAPLAHDLKSSLQK